MSSPGFYGCIGTKAALAAWRATAHLAGWRRLAAGAWHAMTQQLASCAAAEAVDFAVIRPASLAGAAWLLLSLPGGLWLGFVAGKALADVFWYSAEAAARRGLVRGRAWPDRSAAAAVPARAPGSRGPIGAWRPESCGTMGR